MESGAVRCSYVYSLKEYGRPLRHHFRRVVWRMLGLGMVFFLFMLGNDLLGRYQAGQFFGFSAFAWIYAFFVVGGYNLVYVGVFLAVLFPVIYGLSLWTFRGTYLCGKTMTFSLSEDAVRLETVHLDSKFQWELFTLVMEHREGFMLYFGKSKKQFYWLPKHGFPSPESVERCRDLLRNHGIGFEIR